MKARNEINRKYGIDAIFPASNGILLESQKWRMREDGRLTEYNIS